MENNEIDVKRLTASGSQESYPDSDYQFEDLSCYIEKTDPKIAVVFGDENAFNTYLCIINSIVDIRVSDLVIDRDGNEYRVGGVQKFENPEIDSHTELTMYLNQ